MMDCGYLIRVTGESLKLANIKNFQKKLSRNFQQKSKLRGWWIVDIWSGWPVNPGLTQDRPISLLSARLKIQSSQWKVSKFSNWPLTWFGIADHQTDNRVTWHSNKIRDFVNNSKFVFDISSNYLPPNITLLSGGQKFLAVKEVKEGLIPRKSTLPSLALAIPWKPPVSRIHWYPSKSHPSASSGSLYPELTNEFLTPSSSSADFWK